MNSPAFSAAAVLGSAVLLTSCSIPPSSDTPSSVSARPTGTHQPADRAPVLPAQGLPRRHAADAEDDGSGTLSPFDTGESEIGHLDPALLHAVQRAALAARSDGVPFWVTSGWRSRTHQQRLLDAAVRKYGGLTEALRWVSTPETSAHVRGDAVDVGPTRADSWLEQHGSRWGLCRRFANEVWHFELATEPGGTCPAMYPDASDRR